MPEHDTTLTSRLATGVVNPSMEILGNNGGFSIIPQPDKIIELPSKSPIFKTLNTTFDIENFAVPRSPLVVGKVALEGLPDDISVADMVIKWP